MDKLGLILALMVAIVWLVLSTIAPIPLFFNAVLLALLTFGIVHAIWIGIAARLSTENIHGLMLGIVVGIGTLSPDGYVVLLVALLTLLVVDRITEQTRSEINGQFIGAGVLGWLLGYAIASISMHSFAYLLVGLILLYMVLHVYGVVHCIVDEYRNGHVGMFVDDLRTACCLALILVGAALLIGIFWLVGCFGKVNKRWSIG